MYIHIHIFKQRRQAKKKAHESEGVCGWVGDVWKGLEEREERSVAIILQSLNN